MFVVAALAVAAFAPVAGSQTAGDTEQSATVKPGSWRGSGGALGVRAYFNTDPLLLPVTDIVTLHIPDAITSWNSTGDANARASSIFPSQTVIGAPDLLATFGVPMINEILPPYPSTVFASPTNPDATSTDGTSRARIGGGLEFIEADGRADAPGLTDALGPFIELGPMTARSRQDFQEGALVSRSEALIDSVSILGNVLRVDGVEVVAKASSGETAEPQVESSVTVGSVSIAGRRVGVRSNGIEVGGVVIPPGGLPDSFQPSGVAGQVNEVVKALGLSIRLVGGDNDVDGRAARAQATGLAIDMVIPVDGPQLPSIPLNALPVDLNELIGNQLPLPLPDADPNVIYRNYLLSVVIGEANADVFADAGGGDLSGDLALLGDGETPSGSPLSEGMVLGSSEQAVGGGAQDLAAGGVGAAGRTGDQTDVGGRGLSLLGASTASRLNWLIGLLALFGTGLVAALRFMTLPMRRRW